MTSQSPRMQCNRVSAISATTPTGQLISVGVFFCHHARYADRPWQFHLSPVTALPIIFARHTPSDAAFPSSPNSSNIPSSTGPTCVSSIPYPRTFISQGLGDTDCELYSEFTVQFFFFFFFVLERKGSHTPGLGMGSMPGIPRAIILRRANMSVIWN